MYERNQDGIIVEWAPDDEELALQAMEDVDGTGVSDESTLPNDANVPVDIKTAKEIKARYRELHINKYGEDSRYYNIDA